VRNGLLPSLRHSGMDCPGLFETKTEDELMKHVELHVGEAHPDMEMTPENAAMVRAWFAPPAPITLLRPSPWLVRA
jgi:hypothetical protein